VVEQASAAELATIYLPARALYILQHVKEVGLERSLYQIEEILSETRARSLALLEALCLVYAAEVAYAGGDATMCKAYASSAVSLSKIIQSPWIEMKSYRLLLKLEGSGDGNEQKSGYISRIKQLSSEIQLHSTSLEYLDIGKKLEESFLI
jgi:hypothetical protein